MRIFIKIIVSFLFLVVIMIINGLVKTARGNHVIGIPSFILVPAILAGLAAIWSYKSASQDTTADSANLNKNQ